MNNFVFNNEFDKKVVCEKLAKIASELDEEMSKNEEERDLQKEKELIYAQFIQGLKLNVLPNRKFYF